ncbi:uncharacterized protein LOC131605549 [Vicia villosa]|uniref:uncharacterized protein LOC131605549 n=1 Tax=Vicia villosa TaxID=3911 RepID=UPI00273C0568|nr:uncharacterized protein LOC131605549 [Vicia villosa]
MGALGLKGSDIHVKVPNAIKQAYDSLLTFSNTYTISKFQVSLNDLLFKPLDHKFMLTFTDGTSVNDKNKHEIPPKSLNFTPFIDIISGKLKKGCFNRCYRNGSRDWLLTTSKRNNNNLNCTLWEGCALQFHDFNKDRKDFSLPSIIILQFAKVKVEGKFPLCVSNTFNVTKLHVNDDLPEIKNFLDIMPKLTIVDCSSQGLSLQSQIAKVNKLEAAQGGWCYQRCHECPRVAKGDQPTYVGISDPLEFPLALDALVGLTMTSSQSIVTPNLTQTNESVVDPVTPTSASKRIALKGSNDFTPLSQCCDGKEPSTKLKKHIKLEK